MALTTNARINPDGVVRRSFGDVVSDAAAAAAVTFECGFAPKRVVFHNITDRISDEWLAGMADASSLHTIATGVRTLETTNGITPTTNGFTVTAVTMVASKSFSWYAEG